MYYDLCRIITNMAHGEAGNRRPDPHSQVLAVLHTLYLSLFKMTK